VTKLSIALLATVFLATAMPAQAQAQNATPAPAFTVGDISIEQPWARATPAAAPVAGGYLTLINKGKEPDRLLKGTTDIAGRMDVHEMSLENGVMKMREVTGGLEVKPGATVEMKPSGYHIMFMNLKHGLKEGDHFKAQLEFEKAGKTEVEFVVRGMGATSAGAPLQHTH
jgi:hypothetical protein